MLSFRDEDWIFRHGPSRFEAWIMPGHRKPEDVRWSLELCYMAGGARWRRVRDYLRPAVHLSIGAWKVKSGRWTDLEGIKHWGGQEEIERRTGMPWFLSWEGGTLDLGYQMEVGGERELDTWLEAQWQVREREGARFLVEVAAGGGAPPPAEEKTLVLADGTQETEAPLEQEAADFWKQHATAYAMEWVPFGKVIVRVPRNAKDHLAYARRRAQELLGISTPPEAYRIHDLLKRQAGSGEDEGAQGLHDDVYVHLHFHGHHEDE